ncbi:hypothetical protein ACIO3R_17255 [Streptomyces sp. NPDC087428]|uniref:hypothetical protein n=1 Tax=Streptomyces sp. NPDC087428 TaxID=3365788 RepID=UPI0037F1C2BC
MRIARKAGVALAGLVMVGGLATATSGSASAAADEICGYPAVDVFNDAGKWAGSAQWSANPGCGVTGDTLGAFDATADGYGVVAHLSAPDGSIAERVVSTSGHNSPYTAWKSGNLPEGHQYVMWACLTKGGVVSHCSKTKTVTS